MIPPRSAKRHGQSPPRARNYFSRREQFRLLFLVMMLGLVFWAIHKAADPDTWAGLWRDETPQKEPAQGEPAPPPERPDDQPDDHEPPAEAEASGRYFPGVNPEYLKAVDDDVPFFWAAEHPAWFNLLGVLKSNDPQTLRAASTPVSYVQLMDQSQEYRGELVTVRGVVRGVDEVTPPENDKGITKLYRLTVRPANSRKTIMVWCLELPEGFPISRKTTEDAQITGFFFKLWMFTDEETGTQNTAPALLARTVRWFQTPPIAEREPPSWAMTVLIVLAASVFSVMVVVYVYTKTRRAPPPEPDQPVRLEELEKLDLPSGPRFPGDKPTRSSASPGAG